MNAQHLSRRRFLLSTAAFCGSPLLVQAAERGSREVAWLDEVQSPPAEAPGSDPRLRPLLIDESGKKIVNRRQWEERRRQLRRWWIDFLRPPPRNESPPEFRVLEEDRDEGVLRQKIAYETAPGIEVEAYLIKPLNLSRPAPGVAALHSTVDHTIRQPAGLEGAPEKAFGLKLAQRGVVTISPRNFLWPRESKIQAHQRAEAYLRRRPGSKGMAKMLHDSQVALEILANLPDVDPQRLGAVGHSLGAKEVLYLAAFDERVKAAVSSEGGVGTTFSNWHDPWYLGDAIQKPGFGHEHHELLALAAPRAFLLVGGESADGDRGWPYVNAALEIYRLYEEPPRLGFYNHHKGHAVPPEAEERIYEWMTTYL
ncbi:MAG: dienelactone hydrolase family protein [Planctomycetes bacterium]|nr:dienelactone hydrolase family protein [Planctomycetota bacterium]